MLGAVYSPAGDIVPPLADQVTAVLLVPVTVAVNGCVPPGESDADVGEIATAIVSGALTVTVANADFVVSAALVAFTV